MSETAHRRRPASEAARVLAAHAAVTEERRRPAPESIAAVRDAGLFALTVPAEAGGLGASAREQCEAVIALGRGCPSTAWVTALSAGAKAILLASTSDSARAALLADPHAIVCGSGATRGVSTHPATAADAADGVIVSGRWTMASGCEDADWAMLMAPGVGALMVETTHLTVERTWHVAGMAGTGSHTLVADGLHVPADRVIPRPALSPGANLAGVVGMLAPLAGATLAMRDIVAALLAGDKAPYGSRYARIADSPSARTWFTDAERLAASAEQRLLRTAGLVDAGDPLTLPTRVRLRADLTTAARECRQATEKLLDLGGTSGFALDQPLQRLWRDVEVGSRHPQFNPYLAEDDLGGVLTGAGEPMSVMV
ncbi:acyl-CoA dehydrogenase family protein [Catenuloplanes sp. NPDC051500]|uniref:acyl-CoA dehydrogenase family protein n=1 Tax=Catenuloplanes sp. NPDC051500 TaxID=3363959 RepID=UPI0037AB0900